jgi:hypothetical protein
MRHIGKPIANNPLRYVTMSDILHNNNSGYVHCLRCARHPSVLAFTSTLAYGRLLLVLLSILAVTFSVICCGLLVTLRGQYSESFHFDGYP